MRAEAANTMGSHCANESAIDDRRTFLRELQTRDEVVNTDFSRDGYHVIYIEVAPDAGFHQSLQERARDLGYSIDPCNGGVYRLSQE